MQLPTPLLRHKAPPKPKFKLLLENGANTLIPLKEFKKNNQIFDADYQQNMINISLLKRQIKVIIIPYNRKSATIG